VTEDGTEIVYEGDAAAGKSAMIEDDAPPPRRARPLPAVIELGTSDRVDTRRMPPVSARTARVMTRERESAPDRSDDAGAEYRAAVELVRAGNQTDAIAGLRGFLRRFPRHDYADNAQYWLGEAFYAQKDYPHALGEFRNVIETYPRGNKVPDALLKVGTAITRSVRREGAGGAGASREPLSEDRACGARREAIGVSMKRALFTIATLVPTSALAQPIGQGGQGRQATPHSISILAIARR